MKTVLLGAVLSAFAAQAKAQSADDRFIGGLAASAAALKPAPRPPKAVIFQDADEATLAAARKAWAEKGLDPATASPERLLGALFESRSKLTLEEASAWREGVLLFGGEPTKALLASFQGKDLGPLLEKRIQLVCVPLGDGDGAEEARMAAKDVEPARLLSSVIAWDQGETRFMLAKFGRYLIVRRSRGGDTTFGYFYKERAPRRPPLRDPPWTELERRSDFSYKEEAQAACEKAKKNYEGGYEELRCEAQNTGVHEAEYVLYGRGKKVGDEPVLLEQTAGFDHPVEAEAACEKAKKKYEAEYDELKCEAYYFESHAAEYKLTGRRKRR